MRDKLREANIWLRLAMVGAAAWILFYSFMLIWPILVSDAPLLHKVAAVFAFACFFLLHYAAGFLDGLGLLLGLLGLLFFKCGEYLIKGRSKLRDVGRYLAAVFSDRGDKTSPWAAEGDGTRDWPKGLILVCLAALLAATIGIHFLARTDEVAMRDRGNGVVTNSPHIGSRGLPREEFKNRFQMCSDCGGD
jgi:hypothetical protein